MRKICVGLIIMTAFLTAVGSCVNPMQELSTYWREHDFHSTESFQDIKEAEKTFEGYISLLEEVSVEDAVPLLYEFLDSAALNKVAYTIWTGWFEAYLHILESPYNNEPLFQAWLEKVTSDKVLDAYIMDHLMQIKQVSNLNAVGSTPSDVMLMDIEGNHFMISDLKGKETLMLFFNGGCKSCAEHMSEIYKEYRKKDVRLVAVMINADPRILEQVETTIPQDVLSHWTLTWCPGREIEDGQTYDLTLFPSKILLNSDGTIAKSYHK